MSLRADFYEALTWLALEDIHKASPHNEPSRERHTCGDTCEHRKVCHKPKQYKRLIYTIPDFLVDGKHPHFFHVCYWDSKETSHAKFWRTVSEICDLKRYIPESTSTCVIIEASFSNGTYSATGWYPDFLRSFRELFDSCVFFDHPDLAKDLLKAEGLRVTGTDGLHTALARVQDTLLSLAPFRDALRDPLRPSTVSDAVRASLWASERAFCSRISIHPQAVLNFDRLRNAILQIVFIQLLTESTEPTSDLITHLEQWRSAIQTPDDVKVAQALRKMPIEDRNGQFAFVVERVEEECDGSTRVVFPKTWSCS